MRREWLSNQPIAADCRPLQRANRIGAERLPAKNLLVNIVNSEETPAVDWFYWQVLLVPVLGAHAIFSVGSIDAALNIVHGLLQYTY
jgi:hypothetical protein